jgi:uncharacterized protein
MKQFIIALGLAVLFTAHAVAVPNARSAQPSFDCATNTRLDERTICASAVLSELDVRMSGLYFMLRDALPAPQQALLQEAQRYWLKRRAACSGNANCIAGLYRARIPQLNAVLAGAPPGGTPSSGPSPGGKLPLPPPPGIPDACVVWRTLC